jgi:LAO/AO transport system kinase
LSPDEQLHLSNQRAVAKALSAIERGGEAAESLLRSLKGRTGKARTAGVTGAPGVGKSTLVQALGRELLADGALAVLAVDPSSPFTGGALLGDRVRMPELVGGGAFVRSMATRGALGGLATATGDAIDLLDAAGFSWVIVETVGVGQAEVDVAGEVDTVILVTVAGLGDDVQAAKAGLLEIGDIFAVNKADRPGADAQVELLEAMLALRPPGGWQPPVIEVSGLTGEGVGELAAVLRAHHDYLDGDGQRGELRRQRARRRLERVFAALAWEQARSRPGVDIDELSAAIAAGTIDVYTVAHSLLGRGRGDGEDA